MAATGRLRWILLSIVLAALGLVGLVVVIPVALSVALAVVSAFLVVLEVRQHRHAWASTEFVPRVSDSFTDVRQAVSENERFTVRTYANGTFVHDTGLTEKIREGLMAVQRDQPYTLAFGIKSLGQRYLEECWNRPHNHLFNGEMLGWDSDVGFDMNDLPTVVALTPGTYFEHIASDQLAMVDTIQEARLLEQYGRRLFIGRRGMLRDLGASWLLNGIGASTLAFTSDGKLLLIHQGQHNLNSPGLLAPSGSGALEPKDFGQSGSVSVAALAENGGNRELFEESTVRSGEVTATHFLGFGRWLEKAGRPELYSVTLLSVDSHELERRKIDKSEKPFVKRQEFTRLVGTPAEWDPEHPDLMLDPQFRGRLSLPLSVCLSQLAQMMVGGSTFPGSIMDTLTDGS